MDFLNKAIAQITDLFRSMTPGARITAGLLLAVLVVSLGYLFNHQSSSPDAFLMDGESLSPSELKAMAGAFAKAKLGDYEFDADHRVRVPAGDKAKYMAALVDGNAVPRGFGDHMIAAIKEAGPFASRKQQLELIQVAKEKELGRILSCLQGVESAEVMFDEHSEQGLSNERVVKTASVFIKPQGNDELADDRVPAIRNFVAGAIGCKPSDITVVDQNSGRSIAAGAAGGSEGADSGYHATKRRYETSWEGQIRKALEFIPHVAVTVNVELNRETEEEKREVKVDPKVVPLDVREKNHSSTTTSPSVGGAPGLAQQRGVLGGANTPAAISSTGPKSEDVTDERTEKGTASQTSTVSKIAGLTPSRVTVTVGVLSSYYEDIWRERNPTPAGEQPKPIDSQQIEKIETVEKKNIQELVAQLIPKPNSTVQEVTPLVTVMTFQHLTKAPVTPPSATDKALFWLGQYWSTLGMLGLGAVSLIVFRSMVRAAPVAELPRAQSTPLAAATVGEELTIGEPEQQQEAAARLKRRAKSGPSLRDELVEIVREDPDSAANILRNWIGSAT
jgi:flagellar M-ring protein FliF